jgi:uncharacterized membrane protein YhiD involved in acid resistance
MVVRTESVGVRMVLRKVRGADLGARRRDRWRFGGRWDHILVTLGRALRSLLPLTLIVVVQGIARNSV